MKRSWWIVPAALWLLAAADWSKWPQVRDIRVPNANAPAGYALVPLDGPVFAAAQRSLQDLRVIDDQGGEVPSKLVIPHEEVLAESRPARTLDRVREANGDQRITLDLDPAPARHNRVMIETDTQNFSRQVRIETSDDNRRWAIARDDGYIFDFSRDAQARYLEVAYPASTKRYLRITILDGGQTPIEIDNVSAEFAIDQEEKRVDWPATTTSKTVDAERRAVTLELDLGFEKIPTSRIELRTTADNFHRHVEIEGGNPTGDGRIGWSSLGSGEIFSVALGETRRRQLWIDYPETRARHLRVRVFHYDDRPLEIDQALVSGLPRQLLFRREPGRGYRLLCGNAEAPAPRYDLEQLSSYLDLAGLPVLSLGETQRPAPAAPAATPWLDRQPLLLWATLLAAALLLGWLILRLARKAAA